MRSIAIIYATREGHTRKFAEQIKADLCGQGVDAIVKNVKNELAQIDLRSHSAAILAASVRLGKHEREMVGFVKEHLAELTSLPTVFLSVSLSEAGVERPGQSQEARARCEVGVKEALDKFFEDTSWYPKHAKAIAGALPYSKYNPIVRFVMKQIVKRKGGDVDTTRDYEYTDWVALDHYVEEVAQHLY